MEQFEMRLWGSGRLSVGGLDAAEGQRHLAHMPAGMNDPFEEGTDAFCRGTPRNACPYPDGTQEHDDWVRGWDDAQRISHQEK